MFRLVPYRRWRCVTSFLSVVLAFSTIPSFASPDPLPEAKWDSLPKWRGFNLLGKFHLDWENAPYREDDFRLISEYGFNFVRLPIDYRTYTDPVDWLAFDQDVLAQFDQAVAWGQTYGIHVQLNLHRIPGYTVASPSEPTSLWTDPETQEAAAAHWRMFAARYRGIPNAQLSFNLLNEPAGAVTPEGYAKVVALLSEAIRSEDPGRLIVADGMGWGREPVDELVRVEVAQATRGYNPFGLTHYRATWIDGWETMRLPTWPENQDEAALAAPEKEMALFFSQNIQPWIDFESLTGTGVMVGEFGAHNETPHDVVLAWLSDLLEMYEVAGLPWACWNFRGSFGPIDSGRADVDYEDQGELRIDREMLNLLMEYTGHRENYGTWADRVFPSDAGLAQVEPQGDFNGDGVSNLWCYAMGMDPAEPSGGIAPRVTVDPANGETRIHFTRSARSVGVEIRLEQSLDRKTWQPVDPGLIETAEILGDVALIVARPGRQGEMMARYRLALVDKFGVFE